jgi:hypothetical protein
VEAGLSNEYLSPNLINEMVRDICTNIRNIASVNPRKNEREMVVEQFPFLGDPPIGEHSNPWVRLHSVSCFSLFHLFYMHIVISFTVKTAQAYLFRSH